MEAKPLPDGLDEAMLREVDELFYSESDGSQPDRGRGPWPAGKTAYTINARHMDFLKPGFSGPIRSRLVNDGAMPEDCKEPPRSGAPAPGRAPWRNEPGGTERGERNERRPADEWAPQQGSRRDFVARRWDADKEREGWRGREGRETRDGGGRDRERDREHVPPSPNAGGGDRWRSESFDRGGERHGRSSFERTAAGGGPAGGMRGGHHERWEDRQRDREGGRRHDEQHEGHYGARRGQPEWMSDERPAREGSKRMTAAEMEEERLRFQQEWKSKSKAGGSMFMVQEGKEEEIDLDELREEEEEQQQQQQQREAAPPQAANANMGRLFKMSFEQLKQAAQAAGVKSGEGNQPLPAMPNGKIMTIAELEGRQMQSMPPAAAPAAGGAAMLDGASAGRHIMSLLSKGVSGSKLAPPPGLPPPGLAPVRPAQPPASAAAAAVAAAVSGLQPPAAASAPLPAALEAPEPAPTSSTPLPAAPPAPEAPAAPAAAAPAAAAPAAAAPAAAAPAAAPASAPLPAPAEPTVSSSIKSLKDDDADAGDELFGELNKLIDEGPVDDEPLPAAHSIPGTKPATTMGLPGAGLPASLQSLWGAAPSSQQPQQQQQQQQQQPSALAALLAQANARHAPQPANALPNLLAQFQQQQQQQQQAALNLPPGMVQADAQARMHAHALQRQLSSQSSLGGMPGQGAFKDPLAALLAGAAAAGPQQQQPGLQGLMQQQQQQQMPRPQYAATTDQLAQMLAQLQRPGQGAGAPLLPPGIPQQQHMQQQMQQMQQLQGRPQLTPQQQQQQNQQMLMLQHLRAQQQQQQQQQQAMAGIGSMGPPGLQGYQMGPRPMAGPLPGMPQARPMMAPPGMPGALPQGLPGRMPGGDQGGLGRFFGAATGQGMLAGQQLPSMPSSMGMGLEEIERSFLLAGQRK